MNKKIKLSILGTLIATSTLAITLPIVSCSSSTSNVDNIQLIVSDNVKKNVEELVTESFRNKMQEDGITIDQQKVLAESWFIGKQIPEDELKIIKENLKFKDKSTDKDIPFDDAINIVVFKTDTIIPSSGNISGPELKFSFNDGYTWDDSLKVGSLGNVAPIGLTVEDSIMQAIVVDVTKSLTEKIQVPGINNAQQAEIANRWLVDTEIEIEELNIIKEKLRFKDIDGNDVTFLNAVKNITFETATIVPNFGVINGPKLKVNFKDGYNGDVSIQAGTLGDAAMPIELTVEDSVMQSVISDVTKSIFDKLQSGHVTYNMQKEIEEKWQINSDVPEDELQIIKENLKFKDGANEFAFDDVVESVTITKEMLILDVENSNIISPELIINFKNGYAGNVMIKVGHLGKSFYNARWLTDQSSRLTTISALNNVLRSEMQKDGITYQEQLDLANSWRVNSRIPDYLIEIINENLKITNGTSNIEAPFISIFENVTFSSGAIVPESGTIRGPVIYVRLKTLSNIGQAFFMEIGELG